MYGKEFTQIEKFVVSSQFEKYNLINNYGYSKKEIDFFEKLMKSNAHLIYRYARDGGVNIA